MPTVPRMTAEDRRAAILHAAVRLFAERGFRGTTTRALAEAVGVSEPVLYEHFASKHELYAAIIETKSCEGMARAASQLEPYAKAKDDRGLLTSVGELVLESYASDQAYARLLLSGALEEPDLGRLFYDRQRPGREALAGYFAARIADGAFRPVDPNLAVRVFMGMLAYHAMQGMLFQDDFVKGSAKEVVAGMVDIFLSGIATGKAAE